jgi:hypothetical protein
MNRATSICAVTIWLALAANPLHAVCLDPKDPDLKTYHRPSLEEEVETSEAIVVVTVVDEQALSEDPSDPGGWTSFIYEVRVEETLWGHAPAEIVLRAQNDSGGYRMSEGERHLLFLERDGDRFSADVCGNSTVLLKGSRALEDLRAFLARSRRAV